MEACDPRLTIAALGAGAECRPVWTGGYRSDIEELGTIGSV